MTVPDPATLARYWTQQDEAIAGCPAYPVSRFEGTGIVIPAGGPRYFTSAWVCINILRESLGCTLPIEVWYLGSGEMSRQMIDLLEPLGADCVDALTRRRVPGADPGPAGRRLNGWELKPYAIIHSRFREILYIDADNVPVFDPSYLLSCPEYQETGALFWPDIFRLGPSHPLWTVCRIQFRDEPAFETGQMVIDKQRCWKALNLTMHFNEHSDFYYRLTRGDAETFHLGWRMLGAPHMVVPHPPRPVGRMLMQHDFQDRLLFQHRIAPKWVAWGENARIPGFVHEERCLMFLHTLRDRWNGQVAVPEPRPVAGATFDEEITRTSTYLYCRVGADQRILEFLPDHRIGKGRAACECAWYLVLNGTEPQLCLEGAREDGPFGVTCTLTRDDAGVWRGVWQQYEKMPVELIPVGQGADVPDRDREYVEDVNQHEIADGRRALGMRAKGLAPDEAGVKPDEVLMIYDRLWNQVRDASERQDHIALFYAIKALLVRYGNNAELLQGRLQSELRFGPSLPDVVEQALSNRWEPESRTSPPRRHIFSRLRRK